MKYIHGTLFLFFNNPYMRHFLQGFFIMSLVYFLANLSENTYFTNKRCFTICVQPFCPCKIWCWFALKNLNLISLFNYIYCFSNMVPHFKSYLILDTRNVNEQENA